MCLFHRFGKSREEFEKQIISASRIPLTVEYQGSSDSDFAESDEKKSFKVDRF